MNAPAKKSTPAKSADIIPESAMPADVPAKVTPTKVADKTPKPLGSAYTMGEGKYNPRVAHNDFAWTQVQKAIANGKGKATHAELCEALKDHQKKTGEHHHDFIGYMVRRDAIRVAK